jgi:hypothetical protein
MRGPWRGAAQPLELVANRGWPNLEGVFTDAIPTITIMVAVNTRSCNPAADTELEAAKFVHGLLRIDSKDSSAGLPCLEALGDFSVG